MEKEEEGEEGGDRGMGEEYGRVIIYNKERPQGRRWGRGEGKK